MLIVFDLDGTLIDSARDLAEAASELVQSYGAEPLSVSEVVRMVGDGAATLVRRALERSALDPSTPGALPRFLEMYDRRLLDHTVAYDGIPEVLALSEQRGPLAVLTNKPIVPSLAIIEALGLRGFFTEVIGGDSPHGRKPDPAGLQALMARAPGQVAVMVGDSPADGETAVAAGCPFVFARYGFGAVRFAGQTPPTTYIVDHPRDLPAVFDRVERGA